MGLEIYAGPLCRYYFSTAGLQRLLRPFKKSPETKVIEWRNDLAAKKLFQPCANWDWPEAMDGKMAMDKPSHFGWSAVRMWAACAEHPDHEPPPLDLAEEQEEAVIQSVTKYTHICQPELWLPVDFAQVFEAEVPNGRQRCAIGSTRSTRVLFREMQQLNDVTWKASETEIDSWNFLEDDSFEGIAKWGFAICYALAKFAHENRLPMILDY